MAEDHDSVLGRIDRNLEKLTGFLMGMNGNPGFCKNTVDDLSEHNRRLRTVEKWMWRTAGAIAVVTFIIAWHLSFGGK